MADIRAFAGIRPGPLGERGRDLSNRIAPPYDVLDQHDKDRLTARDPHNIVVIDLPFIPPKKAGPDEVYERAATTLAQWLDHRLLTRDEEPALYVYHQKFTWDDREYTRRLFLCRLRLEEFGKGSVFPHERTFGGPKEDRLKLMKATRCQLSPIFGLYLDPELRVASLLEHELSPEPDGVAVMDEVENRLWAVTRTETIEAVRAAMRDKNVYVADGHHRYGTAMMYRDWLGEQQGGLSEDHPADFVLIALGIMDDPGMLILPTHRVLVGLDDLADEQLLEAWGAGLDIRPCEAPEPQADFHLFSGRTHQRFSATIRNRNVLRELEPGESDAWVALDMAYLHRYLLDELTVRRLRGGKELTIRYVKTEPDAERTARDEGGMAFLVRATPMEQLRAVSEAGGLMPPKSTFFYPKLATGLVVNPLY